MSYVTEFDENLCRAVLIKIFNTIAEYTSKDHRHQLIFNEGSITRTNICFKGKMLVELVPSRNGNGEVGGWLLAIKRWTKYPSSPAEGEWDIYTSIKLADPTCFDQIMDVIADLYPGLFGKWEKMKSTSSS
jgi:hypothetical protein